MNKPLKAVEMLTEGKTDTELLETLVTCLTDNDSDIIEKLIDAANYNNRIQANIEVLFAVCTAVQKRVDVNSEIGT